MHRDLFQEAGITPSRRDAQGGRDLFAEAGISIAPKTRSFTDEVSDLGTAIWQGAKSTGRALSALLDTALNDRAAVEQTAGTERAAITEQPSAQRALMDEIARRKALDTDPGVLSAISNVGAAMLDNKSGSTQFVASQLGEGTGEYLGELAATGKPDVYDAVLESAAGLSQSVPQAMWSVRQANQRPLDGEPPSASVNAPQPSAEPQNPLINASRQEPINQKSRNNDQSVLPSQAIESDTSALSADQSAPDQRTADQRTADQSQADQMSSADPNLQNRDRSRLAETDA